MKKEEIAKDNFEEDSYDDYDLGIENYNGQSFLLFYSSLHHLRI